MIAEGIFSLLSQQGGVAALVGARIYPMVLPTGPTMPAITWQIAAGQKTTQGLTTRMPKTLLVQMDSWGDTYLEADGVRGALIKALDMKNTQMQLPGGMILRGAFFVQPIDFFAGENELYRLGAEFHLQFQFPA